MGSGKSQRLTVRVATPELFGEVVARTGWSGKVESPCRPSIDDPLWDGMPRFCQPQSKPYGTFEVETDLTPERLSELLDQKITTKTRSVWFPKLNRSLGNYAWVDDSGLRPRYPIYIISQGRPQCITARALEKMGLDFKIVVEPSEVDSYCGRWGKYLHVMDVPNYNNSSVPVRNYVDKISPSHWYWLMDDNIEDFNILTDNQKYVSRSPAMFRAAEDFVGDCENVGQAGFNYYSFAKKTDRVPPFTHNTRIYSCTLMRRDVDGVRVDGDLWRGRYNEDTDLRLRILKAGYNTVLFNMFLAGKVTTQRLSGGNTDAVYNSGDNRLAFAKSLAEQHPDVVRVGQRFGRNPHIVDYSGFKARSLSRRFRQLPDYKLRLDPNGR